MTPNQEAKVQRTAVKLAQALEKSSDAMQTHLAAWHKAGLPVKGLDDGRLLLLERMQEFSRHLRSVYDKEGGAA